ncbi:MAG: aspartate/glutamate racemase family protein [Rhizomicrobium sp.]
MKTIGMLGGMSWESSAVYYRLLNREAQARVGGVASAKIILHSFDFAEISVAQRTGAWDDANRRMAEAAQGLERAGADFVIMCCNTMHCATDAIEKAIRVPFLHIADPLGAAIDRARMRRVALLGSSHTMERDDILLGRLKGRYGLDVIVPQGDDAAEVSRVVYEELVRGRFLPASRAKYRDIIAGLVARGAEGVILGCTELPLLVMPEDSAVPQFDTTTLHATAAVDLALG